MTDQAHTVAVMGTGALGGYYGARFLQAGYDVHFIARGATLAALSARGLRVDRDTETIHVADVSATDRPADVGAVELVLFTTKGHHLPQAVPASAPLVGQDTVVLPLLNGMDISERIAAGLGRGAVPGATTYLPAKLVEPGVVHQAGEERRLVLGPLQPQQEPAARRALALLREADINAELSPAVQTEIWSKFIA
jgi:2-dehydropantoate 2-reductase